VPTSSSRDHPTKTSKAKRRLGKLLAFVISAIVCASVFFGADFYLHYRHGVNLWGYRGPALGRKQFGEKRVAVLGGSTAWGYGMKAGKDFPAQLQRLLRNSADVRTGPISILNLGYNNEGAYSFPATINDYQYLDYDAVLLYSGYNDLAEPNLQMIRHQSPIFRWAGYLPLLPTAAADKILQWENGTPERVIFQPPDLAQLDRAAALETQLGKLHGSSISISQTESATCPKEWQFYCAQIYEAAALALKKNKRVLIVGEPYINDLHVAQQAALEKMIKARFPDQQNVRYVNLGRVLDLRDRSLCWDGMHLTEEGNRRIAEALSKPVLDLIHE